MFKHWRIASSHPSSADASTPLRAKLGIALRGFVQVTPVAINTWCIAHDNALGVAIWSFVIGVVWYRNVGSAARNPQHWCWYAAGSAVGALVGLRLVRLWAGG